MCLDFRFINSLTVKDRYAIPEPEQIIEQLSGAKYFSQLDLTHGYHQCHLHPSDRPKTAFRTQFGSYEWKVMTFGLANAVPAFVRAMNTILLPHLGKYCMCYLDDVIIYSRSIEEHKRHVNAVLTSLHQASLSMC